MKIKPFEYLALVDVEICFSLASPWLSGTQEYELPPQLAGEPQD